MKNKLTTITLLSIGVMLIAPPVLADDEPVKLELSILGSLTRTDTYFEITDSEYLNISLQSSEEIIVSLESIPKTISLQIEASTSTNFTTLTIEGLEVNTTYYKFEDSYKNEAVFVSDENGSYSWTQDLIQPYHVWFQPGENGTVFLPEDCDDYGIWNGLTSTCILAQNLTESVEITTNNVTLNCNGHSITGTGTGYGIYLNSREDVIVQNCTVINFSVGIPLLFASDNTIITSTMSDNHYSIVLAGSFSNTLTDNNALNNWVGIMLNPSSNANNLTNNDASNNLGFGILLQVNSDNILTNNTALNNNVGIHLYRSSGALIFLITSKI
jgi:parallel beta-helix repeat protein